MINCPAYGGGLSCHLLPSHIDAHYDAHQRIHWWREAIEIRPAPRRVKWWQGLFPRWAL